MGWQTSGCLLEGVDRRSALKVLENAGFSTTGTWTTGDSAARSEFPFVAIGEVRFGRKTFTCFWSGVNDDCNGLLAPVDVIASLSKLGDALLFQLNSVVDLVAFSFYSHGKLRRRLAFADGERLTSSGNPLPEEDFPDDFASIREGHIMSLATSLGFPRPDLDIIVEMSYEILIPRVMTPEDARPLLCKWGNNASAPNEGFTDAGLELPSAPVKLEPLTFWNVSPIFHVDRIHEFPCFIHIPRAVKLDRFKGEDAHVENARRSSCRKFLDSGEFEKALECVGGTRPWDLKEEDDWEKLILFALGRDAALPLPSEGIFNSADFIFLAAALCGRLNVSAYLADFAGRRDSTFATANFFFIERRLDWAEHSARRGVDKKSKKIELDLILAHLLALKGERNEAKISYEACIKRAGKMKFPHPESRAAIQGAAYCGLAFIAADAEERSRFLRAAKDAFSLLIDKKAHELAFASP